MDDKTRSPRRFQFTLRTVLVLLLLIACALGFWLQEKRLSKARKLLAAHGLLLEWADLKPDEARATVVGRVEPVLVLSHGTFTQ
jgi:cytochrome oxidase assembly protein ShyY1